MTAFRRLDGIDVADEVSDGHIGSRELFDIAVVGREIGDACCVGIVRQQLPASRAEWSVRVVMDLATCEVRNCGSRRVVSARRIRLFAWPRRPSRMKLCRDKNGVDDLRHDRIVVPNDAGKDRLIAAQADHEVVAQLILNATSAKALFRKLGMATKLGKRLRKITQGRDTSRVTTGCPHSRFDCSYSTPAQLSYRRRGCEWF